MKHCCGIVRRRGRAAEALDDAAEAAQEAAIVGGDARPGPTPARHGRGERSPRRARRRRARGRRCSRRDRRAPRPSRSPATRLRAAPAARRRPARARRSLPSASSSRSACLRRVRHARRRSTISQVVVPALDGRRVDAAVGLLEAARAVARQPVEAAAADAASPRASPRARAGTRWCGPAAR